MSFYPFENPIGFGVADFLALAIAALLILTSISWKRVTPAISRFAGNTTLCMAVLAALPIVFRLALLPNHPVPTPDIYDEFSHLLAADTLRHFRFANPPHPFHRFFETFFTLQEPTYSSIYPIGQGLLMALFGNPWAGVVIATGAFCALVYWMLRGWVAPIWALAGGILAIVQSGPLCYWMNSYWGGAFAGSAGCLVFGSLPRLKNWAHGIVLGSGLGLLILIRPYETLFVAIAVMVYLIGRRHRSALFAVIPIACAVGITLLHNHSVTGRWTTLPYTLSQYQYGVPAALTFQSDPIPHRELTREQEMEYKSQLAFRGAPRETIQSYLLRLEYRVRFYRFFFLPALYVALLFFLGALRERRYLWVAGTIILFALGTNFFPSFQLHYLAPIACLFILAAIAGMERLSRFSTPAAHIIMFLCCFHFLFWYSMHFFDDRDFSKDTRAYETWSGINHKNPEPRIVVKKRLAEIPGKLLVFVHYSPGHIFQQEWVYNEADIDAARIVWARDLGEEENAKLRAYYPDRQVYLLEPDFRPPRLASYR